MRSPSVWRLPAGNCARFLNPRNDPGGRTFAHLTHAGRSGSRNFCASALELPDVARASLCELRDDYNAWLMMDWQAPWAMNSAEAQRRYGLRLDAPDYGNDINRGVGLHILAQDPACREVMEYRAKTTADERSNT